MSGLILKDLYNSSKNIRYYLCFTLLFAVMGIYMKYPSYICFIETVVGISLCISSFSYDEHYSWDIYALSLPVDRKTMVAAKYLELLLLAVGITLVCIVLSGASALILHMDVLEPVLASYSCLCVLMVILSVLLPFLYKMGVERARVIFLVIFGSIGVGGILLSRYSGQVDDFLEMMPDLSFPGVIGGVTLAIVVLYLLSYRISLGIYRKKQF